MNLLVLSLYPPLPTVTDALKRVAVGMVLAVGMGQINAAPMQTSTHTQASAHTSAASAITPAANPTATSQPALYNIMLAEFAAQRGDIGKALAIYRQQAFLENAAPVFERALDLSLRYDTPDSALTFAHAWQTQHPDDVPALFYVTYLALKAHQYELAGERLNEILQYDPNADLSQILAGIYPTDRQSQRELLDTLQKLDIKTNPTLLVMKAGLLLQFNESQAALDAINRALKQRPTSPAYLTLKADILQTLAQPAEVKRFIAEARRTLPDNKSLFLYQTRYLIEQGDTLGAWQNLNDDKNRAFLADDDIKLLAGLVGIDSQRYTDAEHWLTELTQSPEYRSQAYYYLATSAERQHQDDRAIAAYANVMQPDLVLAARKRQINLLITQQRYSEALASAVKLRRDFDRFAAQSYILEADVWARTGRREQAINTLNSAQAALPDNRDIVFAKVLLMPDTDPAAKLPLLTELVRTAPNQVDYQLEYARTLVSLKTRSDEVNALLMPLINDREVGLKARQILAQQALHQQQYTQVVNLLEDNFDILPDIISGLLLREAYNKLGNRAEATRVDKILQDLLQSGER